MALTGELYFRNNVIPAVENTDDELKSFLACDVDAKTQERLFDEHLASLRSLLKLTRIRFEHALKHDIVYLNDSLTLAVDSQLDMLDCEKQRIMNELLNLQKSADANVMQLVLQYFNIMKEELTTAKDNLIKYALECNLLKRQALVLRDMKIFGHYLYLETKSKVCITSLDQESSQFKRCRKAVKDNISNTLSDRGYNDAKVLHVFKLEHKILTSQLQKAASNVDDGKVKGLFCVVPKAGLQSICAFGLHAQVIPTETGPEKTTKASIASGIPNLFQVSWIWAQLSEEKDNEEAKKENKCEGEDLQKDDLDYQGLTVGRGTHYAENLARDGLKAFSPLNSQDTDDFSHGKKDKGCSFQKFSRSSTPSGLNKLSGQDLEEGCFVTLCRVLISKYRTIPGAITDPDVIETFKMGYDSIYSSSTEEYVLLKPTYVLPEFIMHIQMVKENEAEKVPHPADAALHVKTEAWVPPSMVAAKPVRQSDSRGTIVDTLRRSSMTQAEGISGGVFSSSIINNLAQNETLAMLNSGNNGQDESVVNTGPDDNRALLMQKQAILLSINGTVDEFVRHMRDLLMDAHNPTLE